MPDKFVLFASTSLSEIFVAINKVWHLQLPVLSNYIINISLPNIIYIGVPEHEWGDKQQVYLQKQRFPDWEDDFVNTFPLLTNSISKFVLQVPRYTNFLYLMYTDLQLKDVYII